MLRAGVIELWVALSFVVSLVVGSQPNGCAWATAAAISNGTTMNVFFISLPLLAKSGWSQAAGLSSPWCCAVR
jgi:hypothetical protein